MSTSTWKIAPLMALLALGVFALLPGGPNRVPVAEGAIDCTEGTYRLSVDIVDDDTGERITLAGAQILIDPDAQDGTSTRTYTDNGTNDDSTQIGRLQQDEACETTDATVYNITLNSLPGVLDDCDIEDSTLSTALTANTTVTFTVSNCPEIPTPTPTTTATTTATVTPTVTTTPSGATGVTVSAAPSTVNCSGSSFITVVVKSGTANVADGTTVSVTTTSGSLSPTSAPTSGGGILTIFTAGSTSGTATITASAGGQTGTTTVTVNCGAPTAVPTSPPPPPPVQTVAPGGGIRPPNTGDAGLAADNGTNWMIVGIVAVIATSAAGGLVLARRRF